MSFKVKTLLVIIGSLSRGGCETHLLQVLPRLVARGYDVEIFLLSWRGALADEMEEKGVRIVSPWVLSYPNYQRNFITRLYRLALVSLQLMVHLLSRRPQFVHFFLPAGYLIGATISLLVSRSKKIMSRRSLNLYMNGNSGIRRFECFLHTKMDAILGNSKAVVEQLVKDECAPEGRVGLIYNGVENVSFDNRVSFLETINISPNDFVISVVANLIPYKGHMDLLEALAKIKNDLPSNVILVLAGRDDGYGLKLKERSRMLDVDDIVMFLGAFTQVPELLHASDLFVLPSHEEGFSNALLEAMNAELPIIATDVGGNSEAIVNESCGLIVPPQDPVVLSDAILRLINDGALRSKFGMAAKSRVTQEFSVEACVNKYDSLYSSL